MVGDLVGKKNIQTMDRLYNNEAFVGCVILQLLEFAAMDVARLAVIVPLLVTDKIRRKISRQKTESIVESILHCYSSITLNRIFKEMLIVEINSLVMLSQADLLLISPDSISLTEKGHVAIKEMKNAGSERLIGLSSIIKKGMSYLDSVSTEQLYKSMNIQL